MLFPFFIRHISASIAFLSRLPVPISLYHDKTEGMAGPNFQQTAYSFPLAGLVIGLPAAFALFGCGLLGLSSTLSCLVAISLLVLSTGALHEDGLADIADGFWGGHNKARKLAIMRDSAIGTYGVLALILSLAMRVSLLGDLFSTYGAFNVSLIAIACASLSRYAMLQPWVFLPNARPKKGHTENDKTEGGKNSAGLSARFGMPDYKSLAYGGAAALPALLIILFITGFWSMIMALMFFQLAILSIMTLSKKHIGGHTGDILGATQQMSELGLYFALVLFM